MKLKHLLIAFLALTTTLNLSCSEDDDNENFTNSIIGTWEQTKYEEKGTLTKTTGTNVETEVINNVEKPEPGDYTRITFKNDGTYFTSSNEEEDTRGTYTISGNNLIINEEDEEFITKIAVNGSTLTLKNDAEVEYEMENTSYHSKTTVTITMKKI